MCSWVDVGGTFTDVVLAGADGSVQIGKVPTTPDDPVVGGRRRRHQVLAAAGIDAGDVSRFVHGTTLATNVMLQRAGRPGRARHDRGLRGPVAPRARGARRGRPLRPLVRPAARRRSIPRLTFEVRERVDARGDVLVAADRRRRRRPRRRRSTPRPAESRSASCTRTRTRRTKRPSRLRCVPRCPTCSSLRLIGDLAGDPRVRAGHDDGRLRARRAGDRRVPRTGSQTAPGRARITCAVEIMDSSGGVMPRARGPTPGR